MKKNILIGITGGIAAYKIPGLIRLLIKDNYSVTTIVTNNALNFVTKTTLSNICQKKTLCDDDVFESAEVPHISMIKDPAVMLIAPATANIIAKLANGIADNLLTTAFLSFTGPKIIAPAMHTEMYLNPVTRQNIEKLRDIGVHFISPSTGNLSSGDTGIGRLPDIDVLKMKVDTAFFPQLKLRHKKILITCGGTKEKIDSVRYISNDSTGKLGSHLAHMASFMGACVTIISTVTLIDNPELKKVIYVNNASEMHKAVLENIKYHDYLYMAAAVSDFTCKESKEKIERKNNLVLELTGTVDILKDISRYKKDKKFIGFCLCDKDLEKTALEKMVNKNLDYIAANRTDSFGREKRTMTIFSADNKEPVQINNAGLMETSLQLLKLIT